jgi:hypothetical protein
VSTESEAKPRDDHVPNSDHVAAFEIDRDFNLLVAKACDTHS